MRRGDGGLIIKILIQVGTEFPRCRAHRNQVRQGEGADHFRILHRLAGGSCEPFDHRIGVADGTRKPKKPSWSRPAVQVPRRSALWAMPEPACSRDRQCPHLTILDERRCCRCEDEAHIHMPADEIVDDQGSAAVWHGREADPRAFWNSFAGDMRDIADAGNGRTKSCPAPSLRGRSVRGRSCRQAVAHHQNLAVGRLRQPADRLESPSADHRARSLTTLALAVCEPVVSNTV